MKCLIALALCLGFASATYSQNWPSFRGQNGTGVGDGNDPPTTWDTEKSTNILWKTPIPGLGHSSPIIWGDRIFVTTAVSSSANSQFVHGLTETAASADDNSKHSFRVYCLNKKTGSIIWEKAIYDGLPKVRRHVKGSYANPTPATDGKNLVVSFGSEGLYCFDLDGKLLWKQDLGILTAVGVLVRFHWGFGSSPVIYEHLVIVQYDTQNPALSRLTISRTANAFGKPRGKKIVRGALPPFTKARMALS
jgi:outer membrane protein assembly factor BamB